jgi:thioredoxin-related protein
MRTGCVLVFVLTFLLAACGSEREPSPELTPEPTVAPSSEPAAPAEPAAEPVPSEPAAVAPSGPPPEVARPYEDGADAAPLIEAALTRARAENKRVLLMFGANWCIWCRRLDYVLQNDPSVSAALREGWHVVHVDVGTRGSGTNTATIERYGNPVQHGLPCLVVLDAQGQLVHTQETGSLEQGDRHDPARVLAFLNRYRAG